MACLQGPHLGVAEDQVQTILHSVRFGPLQYGQNQRIWTELNPDGRIGSGAIQMQDRLTIREVADELGISRTTVWTMVKNGELSASVNPIDKRQHLVPRLAVEQLKERGRTSRRRMPRTFGMVSDPTLQSTELEDYMREHWLPS